ncbi:hypothetical protein [Streptomyces himalayensis]|uniref:Uncharacterized protein n=1 Tax=Streptomyces himalayensis subsp. himalayensis TaxID=2756131 RepID=A0A7W0DUD0_9ACTN|nr:hypothetical protein [Streptomyces himalayensis]MBA2951458.1 hypothetical protein [Streptomyces himalayensis subsp. himalayensis]
MDEIRWEEPPRVHSYPGGGRGRHAEIAAQLKERPGEWAKVLTFASSETARSMAYSIRYAARLAAYRPAGAFEAVSRKVDGETCVYARYVGEGGS